MKNKTSQSGFTLIELIAVMVILGILAAVIIPRISTITSGAYESNVRNMYGLIKNEVTAQATKAAMTGDFLETYPDPGVPGPGDPIAAVMADPHFYLDRWVGDYDPEAWSQILKTNIYVNSNGAGIYTVTNAVLFMYHPHGRPATHGTWAGGDGTTEYTLGGTATSLEDIYWIYYAPRTSIVGKAAGRELDSYVMSCWKSVIKADGSWDYVFDGVHAADGTATDAGVAGDDPIPDLTYLSKP